MSAGVRAGKRQILPFNSMRKRDVWTFKQTLPSLHELWTRLQLIYYLELGTLFFTHFKAKIASASFPRRQPLPTSTSPSSVFKWAVLLTLTEISNPLLVYFTFSLLFVFQYISNFLLFLLAPLTFQKETCLLLITVLLTSLSELLCSALLKLAAFHAAVVHVAPFFSTSHTRISNRKLHIVPHSRTLRVSMDESCDGNQRRIVSPAPLSLRDCQPHISDTGNGLDFITIQAKE